MVHDVVGFGALSSWRSSLDADNRIRTASGRPGFGPDLGRVSRHQVDLLDWIAETDPGPRLLGATSGVDPGVAARGHNASPPVPSPDAAGRQRVEEDEESGDAVADREFVVGEQATDQGDALGAGLCVGLCRRTT